MSTAQEILDQAIQRSDLNNPDLVPTAQVLKYISSFERRVYLRGARINPDYFGTEAVSETRSAFTDPWNLVTTPGDVAAVTRLEVHTLAGTVTGVLVGDKVNVISRRWPSVEVSPRAYIRGQKVYAYNDELGAADANMVTILNVFYSVLPTAVAALATSLTLPVEHDQLVILPLARVLAIRDRRLDEVSGIDAEFTMELQIFDEAAQIYDHAAVRPIKAVAPPTVASLSAPQA